MQTIYLKKGCKSCLAALVNLYRNPDLSTNIIIVNNLQSKILLLDKRVKKFPFIINCLPTNIGLIPRRAKVLSLEIFLKLKKSRRQRQVDKREQKIYKEELQYNKKNEFKVKKVREPDGGIEISISR